MRFITFSVLTVLLCANLCISADSNSQQTDSNSAKLGSPVDVEFKAKADNTLQRYVRLLPQTLDKGKTYDLLVVLHGHGSDRWQFSTSTQWQETIAVRDFAAKKQMIMVCPDYRAKTSWMGQKAEKDVMQIIADLRKNYKIGMVFICGGSMGGTSSLTFGVLHPELIDGIIAINPLANHLEFENFQDAISESFGGTKQQIPDEYKKRSAEYWPEKINVPVSITLGGKDTIVPPASAARLANVLRLMGKPVLCIMREEMGHSTSYEDTMTALNYVVDTAAKKKN
jgi:dipeptidyl aminopeptidase/acylaminoacyl peptidase